MQCMDSVPAAGSTDMIIFLKNPVQSSNPLDDSTLPYKDRLFFLEAGLMPDVGVCSFEYPIKELDNKTISYKRLV